MKGRRRNNKYCPLYRIYLKNRTDTLRLITYYKACCFYTLLKRIYSIVKPLIRIQSITLSVNFINYHRKMVNEWSGKNLKHMWR